MRAAVAPRAQLRPDPSEVISQMLVPAVTEQMKRLVSDEAVDKLFGDLVGAGAVIFDIAWT